MDSRLKREKLCEDVYFSSVYDEKFKLNAISVNLVVPLDRKSVTNNAVVPYILQRGYKDCPDFTELNRKLDSLYGASLETGVRKYGNYQIINLSLQGVDDRFAIEHEPLARRCSELMCELLLNPDIEDGKFNKKTTELEKQSLIDTIDAEINDKRSYALARCQQILFEGEPCAVKKYGYREEAQQITPQSAAEAYSKLIRGSRVEILFLGSGDPSVSREIFKDAFTGFSRKKAEKCAAVKFPPRSDIEQVEDHMEVSQSKLVLGFSAGEITGEKDLDATRLMVALYGGTPVSRLFMNVREKYSLCYYCAARFDRSSGSILVDSGVEAANRQKAQSEILNQLEVVKNGEFDPEELEAARLSIKDSIRSASDSLGSLESYYFTQIMSGSTRTPEEDTAAIDAVTRQDVIDAANRVSLRAVYFLTGNQAG